MSEAGGSGGQLLSVRIEHWNGLVRVRVAGEVDIATESLFQRAMAVAEAHAKAGIIVDLRDVAFMDSTGIAALLAARKRADEAGRGFVVRGVGKQVQRVFVVSGLHWLFEASNRSVEQADPASAEGWEPVSVPEEERGG